MHLFLLFVIFLNVVTPSGEHILTTFYGLYFNHQLHIKITISSISYMFMWLHDSDPIVLTAHRLAYLCC